MTSSRQFIFAGTKY